MAIRNFFGGLSSFLLILAKVILCLLFVVFDRLISAGSDRGLSEGMAAGGTPPVA